MCQSQPSHFSLPSDLEHKFMVTLYIFIGYLVFTFAVEIPVWHSASLEEVWELLLRLAFSWLPLGSRGAGSCAINQTPRNHLLHHQTDEPVCLPEAPTVTPLTSRQSPLPLLYVCALSVVVILTWLLSYSHKIHQDRQPLNMDHLCCSIFTTEFFKES